MKAKLHELYGQAVRCPACGGEATVKRSFPRLFQPVDSSGMAVDPRTASNPNYALCDCKRCGKTQYPSVREVEVIPGAPGLGSPPPEPEPDPLRRESTALTVADMLGQKAGKHGR